jgi:hypothetical protein
MSLTFGVIAVARCSRWRTLTRLDFVHHARDQDTAALVWVTGVKAETEKRK